MVNDKKNTNFMNASLFDKLKRSRTIMIGDGEDSLFIEIGLSPEAERRRLERRMDIRLKEFEIKQDVKKVKNKVLSLFKK